jgi:hypothetical protein
MERQLQVLLYTVSLAAYFTSKTLLTLIDATRAWLLTAQTAHDSKQITTTIVPQHLIKKFGV